MTNNDNEPHRRAPAGNALGGAALAAVAFAMTACGGGDDFALPTPGPGVVFSFPLDGQRDVPVGARVIVSFSDPVDADAVAAGCSGSATNPTGAFCVTGPDGPLAAVAVVAGDDGNVLHFTSPEIQPGTEYSVFVRPDVLSEETRARAGERPLNLPDAAPLLSFVTRQDAPLGAAAPTVAAVNGEDPAIYEVDSGRRPALPFMDFGTARVLFSEPIDTDTITVGGTFEFVEIDGTGGETAVPGNLIVQGVHLSFDPTDDLSASRTYRMRLGAGIRDLSGDPLVAAEFEFLPETARLASGLILQGLAPAPLVDGSGGTVSEPVISRTAGAPINAIAMSSPLVGDKQLLIEDGVVEGQMADPTAFEDQGGMIPLTIRKGQLLATSGLAVDLGGAIPSGLDTGSIAVQFISDATGYVIRNPYRDIAQIPDDIESPAFVVLTFDVAVTATDATGNAVLNQTIMGVQATGTAVPADGALGIETVGTLELDLLGAAREAANMVLRLATSPGASAAIDTAAPALLATYPFDGQDDFPVADSVLLTFTEPIDVTRFSPQEQVRLRTAAGTPIDFSATASGSTLVLHPRQQLAYGTAFEVIVSGVHDLAGNLLLGAAGDPTGGDGQIDFATPVLSNSNRAPVALTALHPGAPCALRDGSAATPGRCVNGQDGDDFYAPFGVPGRDPVEGYVSGPLNESSLTLGQSCGAGSVRVELTDAAGACVAPVAGALLRRERGFRFVPEKAWIPGQRYRLVLVPGGIRGIDGQSLNTDILQGAENGEGGGETVVIPFVGEPAVARTYLPAVVAPFTDTNGNGFIDGGEIPRDENRAAVRITDTSGIVTSASIDQPDCVPATPETEGCMYLSGSLPVAMGELQQGCQITVATQQQPLSVDECIPVRLFPGMMYGTTLTMDSNIIGLPVVNNLQTGMMVVRVRERPDAPAAGFIVEENGQPQLIATLELYMDAPDMSILGGLASHDMQSKPVTVTIKGPVTFLPDGRIRINVSNTHDVNTSVTVSALVDVGTISMQIPAGEMKLQLLSRPLKGSEP